MRTPDASVTTPEQPIAAESALPAHAAGLSLAAGPLGSREAKALQRAAGNRVVARLAVASRLLQRDVASMDAKRNMREGREAAGYKPDVEVKNEQSGILWDYDPFDRTLTLFSSPGSAAGGIAVRLTYADRATPDIPKLMAANDLTGETQVVHSEILSPLRAKALLTLRDLAGKYQEEETAPKPGETGRKERVKKSVDAWRAGMRAWAEDKKVTDDVRAQRKQRLAAYEAQLGPFQAAADSGGKLPETPPGAPIPFAKVTMCNAHVGSYSLKTLGVSMGGMDPRQQAIDKERSGSFRTMQSDPFQAGQFGRGPRAGDIISYGMVSKAAKKDGLRTADFGQIMHVGVLKSRRPGTDGGTEIWTVIDGGQGGFDSRQETRERVRIFTTEKLTANLMKASTSGKAVGPEMEAGRIKTVDLECGVFKGKPNDYLLRGWIDIDNYASGKSDADPAGAGARIFTQKKQ